MTAGLPDDEPASAPADVVRAPDPCPTTLDRIVHDRIRLGILAALALNASLTFTDLKRLLGATDGNLTVHARRLEDAGYITVTKTTDRRAVRTSFSLAPAGRAALRRYLAEMKLLVERLGARGL
jgi:DNA-binding MarR family transcriptional regulator